MYKAKNYMIAILIIVLLSINTIYLYYSLGKEIQKRKMIDSEVKFKNALIKNYDNTVCLLKLQIKNLKNKA